MQGGTAAFHAPFGDELGFFADGRHKIHAQHSGQGSHIIVGLLRQLPQLAHVAQYGDLLVALGLGQNLQRRSDGLGIGVVAVVQQQPVLPQPQDPHPGAGGLVGSHAPDDLLRCKAQLLAYRHCHGGRIGHVLAGRRNGQMIGLPLRGNGAGDALHSVIRQIADADVAVFGLAAAQRAERKLHGVEQGVVTVQDRHAPLLEVFKDLALSLEDALPAAQKFHMGIADVGDDGNGGPHHLAQVADLPEVVHPRLHHGGLMLGPQIQQRQGGADVVVEIPLGLEHPELCPQNSGHHLLGGGLTHGAGDLDHRDIIAVPAGSCQGPQRQTGVRHLDVKLSGQQLLRYLGAQTPGGPCLQGRVDKAVAVVLLPLPGDEQGSRLHLTAVGTHRGHWGKRLPRRQQTAAYCGFDLTDRHWLHRNLHAQIAHF